MPEPQSTFYPVSPIKNTPIRIPPPYPYGYDDSNYLSNNSSGRTRQNILNIINEQSFELTDNSNAGVVKLPQTERYFNSLSTATSPTRYSSSLPRSLRSSDDDNVQDNNTTLNSTTGRSAIEINSRSDPIADQQSVYLLEHENEQTYMTSTVSRNWEYVNVSLTRVPGYGFGIAVSGGCDNPHFANGDPAIAISDVLKGGPAQGKLQINDRIVSANGISLDNVDYSTAVQILRDSGPSVLLRVKRRVNPQSYKVSVPLNSKRVKKLSFESMGFTVSVTLQIKTVDSQTLGLREGDLIDKIQGFRVNELFNEKLVCKELRKVIEDNSTSNTTHLNLTVKRTGSGSNNNRTIPNTHSSNAIAQACQSVGNLYVQPPTRANNKSFDSTNTPLPPPPPMTQHVIVPPPPPPRPPLPTEFETTTATTTHPLRSINFIKQNQLGIRLSGGNKSGIIVSAVQKNSQADLQGLVTHDKIIRVNEHDFLSNPPTREQAIEILSSIPNDTLVNLTVEKLGPNTRVSNDEFYVRTFVATDEFKLHEILLVTDTLVNGLVGQWEAYRLDHQGNKQQKLIIPNMKNGRELLKKSWKRTTSFRNREYEDLLQTLPATEPYEIVETRTAEIHDRPVVLYTPMNSSFIESLMMMKHATRLFKVVRGVDELEFNDARVRVINEVVSVRGIQELHEKRVFPFVVFANFGSKEALKEACKDSSKYSKCKKLFSVLSKVKEKLGSYVDMVIELRDCEDGAVRLYEALVQGGVGRGVGGCGGFFAKVQSSSSSPQQQQQHHHHQQQNGTPQQQHHQQSTPSKRSHSAKPRTPTSSAQKDSTLHRPQSSQQNSNHARAKSTDSLANAHAQYTTRTPTSPSPASISSIPIPNYNLLPAHSILEQNPIDNEKYEKRVNIHRSATSVGGDNSRPETRSNHHPPVTPTNVHNNFAHSPVFERRDNLGRAQSNPPPIRNGGGVAQGVVPPPMVDRSKKPSGLNGNVFYPIGVSPSSKVVVTPKPVPPPKPRVIVSKMDVSRSLFRPVSNASTLESSNDDSGQTYLNIPMGSKAAVQVARERELLQQQQQQLQQQQQQQQQSNVTSGVFDWRGGRLVQAHTFGSQIPIEVFIPERAIPHGETVTVWFQIVDYNVREDNQNPHTQKKMLSPLVKFGPENYRFQIPVEIRIPQYCANGLGGNDNNMLAKVLMNNHSDYWTKIDIQNGNFQQDSDFKIVSLTVQQF